MITSLILCAVAQQTAAPTPTPPANEVPRLTALRGEAWGHSQAVTVLSVAAVTSVALPFEWVSAGFRESQPGGTITVDPETGDRTYWSVSTQRDDVLTMDQDGVDAAIAGLGSQPQFAATTSLPTDSTLIVAWDVASGQVQVQMGRDFKTPLIVPGRPSTSPYCYRTSETPLRKLEVDQGGAVVVTPLRNDGEPPQEMTLWTELAGEKIGEGQRVSPGQVDIAFEEAANSGAGATTATISHGMPSGGSYEFVAAKSTDGLTYFFWYRAVPQAQ